MADLRRRDVLAGFGASAVAAVLGGCTPRVNARRPQAAMAAVDAATMRQALRDAVARLAPRYPQVVASAARQTRLEAAMWPGHRGVTRDLDVGCVVRIVDGVGRVRERAAAELSPGAIAELVRALGGAEAAASSGWTSTTQGAPLAAAPDDAAWLAAVDALDRRLDRAQDSRIVHRGVRLGLVDEIAWVVTPGLDQEVLTRRGRAEVALAAWAGTRPEVVRLARSASEIETGAAFDDAALIAAAAQALELLTPGPLPDAEDVDVVLSPERVAAVAVALVEAEVVAAVRTGPWAGCVVEPARPIDGLGAAVASSPLLAAAASPWRASPSGALAAELGPLRGPTGDRPRAGLLDDGFALEGAGPAWLDAAGIVHVAAARARRLVGARPTGHVWGEVVLSVPLDVVLGAAIASTERERVFGVEPATFVAEMPAVRLRGRLRQVRA